MKYFISFIIRTVPRKYLQLFSHIILKFASVFYVGNNVQCPVCNHKFRKFLPYGRMEPRENALCANCLALERHRLMWLYLKEKTSFFSANLKVLHVAPEICFINRFEALPNIDYITADIESPLAKVKMDLHNIPFDENTFDVVFCNHVLEHVKDDIQCLKEIYRVLKTGGWAILQSPLDLSFETTYEDSSITDPKEREKAFKQSDHLRLFGRDYGKRLALGGFNVTEDDYVKKLPLETVNKHALPIEETLYICGKV